MPKDISTDEVGSLTPVYSSYLSRQILASFVGLVALVGVLGNSTVVLAVVLSRKPRTITNIFVVNLAVVDLVTCLSMPIMVLAVLSESQENLLVSEDLCAFQGFVLIVCLGCSLNNIATIAVYRALVTRKKTPGGLLSLFNRCGLVAMICANWLVPLAVGLLPIVSKFGSYGYDENLSTCSFNPSAEGSGTFSKIMAMLFFPVQLVVTFASYAVILYTVKKRAHRVNVNVEPPLAIVGGTMRSPPQPGPARQQHTSARGAAPALNQRQAGATTPPQWARRIRSLASSRPSTHAHAVRPPVQARPGFRRELSVTRYMFLLVFCFVTCCTPFFVLAPVLRGTSLKVLPFFASLMLFNSCINPVIYAARHPDLKEVMRSILLCRLSKIPMKSSFCRRLLRFRD